MKNTKKRSLVLLASVLGLTTLVGCNKDDEKKNNNQEDNNQPCEHMYGQYVSNNDATCTKNGTKTATCTKCGEKDTIEDIGTKKNHSYTNYVSNNDATCTADGTKTAKCDNCDERDTQPDVGSAKGHSFTNYVSNNNATCTADGTKTAKCDNCDVTDTIKDNGTMKPHEYGPLVPNNNATCTENGTQSAKCKNCDDTITSSIPNSAKGHSFAETYTYDNEYHWYAATCGHDVVSEKEAHSFGDPVVEEPTVEKNGKKTFTCKCGYSYEEPISNEPLVYTNEIPYSQFLRTAATCTAPATYYYSNAEGETGTIYFEYGEPIDHNFEFVMDTTGSGRNKLVCPDCGFNSSKDYSNKADNELTDENIADILLNSNFSLRSESEYYGKVMDFTPNEMIKLDGYLYFGEIAADEACAFRIQPLGNDAFYLTSTVFELSSANYVNAVIEQYTNIVDTKEMIRESEFYPLKFASLRFTYDEESSSYVGKYNNDSDTVLIKIENKQITDIISNDGNKCDRFMPEDIDEQLDYIIKQPTIVDGVIIEKEGGGAGCDHYENYLYHSKNDTTPRAYVECVNCGFNSLNAGDYSEVEDNELSSEAISDLILNSYFGLEHYNWGYTYYFKNGVRYQDDDGYVVWNMYKSLGNNVLYHEEGSCYPGIFSDYWAELVPATLNLYSEYEFLPAVIASYRYEFNSTDGEYANVMDLNTMYDVRVKVTDGAIEYLNIYDNYYGDILYAWVETDTEIETAIDEIFDTIKAEISSTETDGVTTYTCTDDYDTYTLADEPLVKKNSALNEFISNKFDIDFDGSSFYSYNIATKEKVNVTVADYGIDVEIINGNKEYRAQYIKYYGELTYTYFEYEDDWNKTIKENYWVEVDEIVPVDITESLMDTVEKQRIIIEYLWDIEVKDYVPSTKKLIQYAPMGSNEIGHKEWEYDANLQDFVLVYED